MDRDVKALAVLLAAAGVAHAAKPAVFEAMVPRPLPRKRELVYASGAAEVACAAMLAHPSTRRWGGYASTVLLAGVFPANVQMTVSAMRSSRAPGWYRAGTIARLPLQLPLVRTALKAARAA
ncbi:MauE/DoxX family redox-associated membrane protein [Aeromicrobium sp. CF4.19]|uniref:DoxX family protein n=1 Tax=Aeromicrobium sp. CF4.19 TaxID=3373082 RepID=UPI003EE57043